MMVERLWVKPQICLVQLVKVLEMSSSQVKDGGNEPIKHGGCLGLGLAAMGARRADVYEQLKFTLYQVL